MWSLYAPGYMADYNEGEGRERWASWLGFVSFWLLVPFAVAGAVLLRRRRVPITPLVAQFVIVAVTAAVIYGLVRFRVPAEVSLAVLAAVAVDRLVPRLEHAAKPGSRIGSRTIGARGRRPALGARSRRRSARVPEPHRSDFLVTDTPANGAAEPDDPATSEPGSAPEVVIIGAGPAGLTAAYMLTKRGVAPTVLEADDVVGGISRTAVRDGWRFDIGGHRFFTKVKPVERPLVRDPRPGRVPAPPAPEPHLLPRKFYDYPINAMNALKNLGPVEAVALHGLVPVGARQAAEGQDTLEGFVVAASAGGSTSTSSRRRARRCGACPCSEIQADWGAQRIKDLSMFRAVWEALRAKRVRQRATRASRSRA